MNEDIRQGAWTVAAAFAILAFPYSSLLVYHRYPPLSPESLLVYAWLLAAAILFSMVVLVVRRPLMTAVTFALLITGVAVLQDVTHLPALALLALGAAGLLMVLGRHGPAVLAVAFLTMSGSGFMFSHSAPPSIVDGPVSASPQQPRIVHLILDGHTSLQGIPPHNPPGWMNQRLTQVFVSRGFRLQAASFSRYSATVDSLFNMMNFQAEPTTLFQQSVASGEQAALPHARYLDLLAEAGYRLHIVQTPEVNLCAAAPPAHLAECRTLPIPQLDSIRESGLAVSRRASFLLRTLINQSPALGRLVARYGINMELGIAMVRPALLDEITDQAIRMGPGHALLAHVLLPHSPYAYDAACRVRYETEPWERLSTTDITGLPPNSPATRDHRYGRYLEQMACLTDRLDAMLQGLEDAGILDQTVMIVHGDHGARITLRQALAAHRDTLTPEDLRDQFSALFAARIPGRPGGTDLGPTPLEAAFAETLGAALGWSIDAPDSGSWIYLSGPQGLEPMGTRAFEPPVSP